MKRNVYVLTEIYHYDVNEIHVYAYAYARLPEAKEDMIAQFNLRLEDVFDSNENNIVDASDVWMELRKGECYCTWGIECQSVEFDN